MKYTINQISQGEEELILNYLEMNPEVERVLAFMRQDSKRLLGWKEKEQVVINPEELLYLESVDGKTFAYTAEEVYRLPYSLSQLEAILWDVKFFRCSKSMIINIDQVAGLKSLSSNRIDAMMKNGEHILITRTYASDFRRRLKGGM
ncbi:MAG: LytTR family transcriptional regulator DNA-binding domain-containing protein [Lachnospiraceae bacterium]|nr:LytTR family transcriptional regulator DNA-binding domain-containing protein [Lachnospiraceae bacterium]